MASVMTKTAKPRRKTRRKTNRAQVSQLQVKGVLTRNTSRAHAPFIVWDISENGLGIWLPLELTIGEEVTLCLAKPKPVTVKGRIMWCQMRPGKLGFHAGVMVEEGQNRLIAMHRHLLEIETFAFETKMQAALKPDKE